MFYWCLLLIILSLLSYQICNKENKTGYGPGKFEKKEYMQKINISFNSFIYNYVNFCLYLFEAILVTFKSVQM